MLVGYFNALNLESVPLNFNSFADVGLEAKGPRCRRVNGGRARCHPARSSGRSPAGRRRRACRRGSARMPSPGGARAEGGPWAAGSSVCSRRSRYSSRPIATVVPRSRSPGRRWVRSAHRRRRICPGGECIYPSSPPGVHRPRAPR
uniref:Uncharacterized protein n=1 Tax=Mycobacterium sp. (strain MCS) TaxID=164756 RepID=A0A5Q5BEJ7_MYCSS